MKSTKVLKVQGNRMGNQYAPHNCSPYGTKWRIAYQISERGSRIIGSPVLLASNIEVQYLEGLLEEEGIMSHSKWLEVCPEIQKK